MKAPVSVLLLGIGNVLWADEGFGVRVVEHLQKNYLFSDSVTVMDGGTQGVYLIEAVQAVDVLVIFDAVDYGLKPGTMKCLENDEVPNYLGAKKMSLHQTGFQEVLAMAQMLGRYPEHLLLVGVQPVELEDYGGSLRDEVKAKIQPAVDHALDYLRHFGFEAEKAVEPVFLSDPVLDIERYERERPSESDACRVGDSRVLASGTFGLRPPETSQDGSLVVDVDYRGQY
ncbi:MAG: HyaD/HybD family hydrogenase maturation endopeptidase [Gammaproteobacteria bacterium]